MALPIPFNFAGLSEEYSSYNKSEIIILPVSFDKTSTWLRGSKKGPKAIINASRYMELYDIETNTEPFKKGIHTAKTIKARNSKDLNTRVYDRVKKYSTENKYVIILGGEHSVSLGSILAHHEHHDDLSVLHLDAHADVRDTYEGDKFNHACVMARVREKIKKVVSVGIRSLDISEVKIMNQRTMITMSEIVEGDRWIDRVTKNLSENVYVTIDLDVFDPAIMPSTGTPEPGGLSWYQATNLLKIVMRKHRIVGFDVVELCPTKNKAADYLAAKLVYKLIGYIFFPSKKVDVNYWFK